MMKKWLLTLLCAAGLAVSLCACGNSASKETTAAQTAEAATQATIEETSTEKITTTQETTTEKVTTTQAATQAETTTEAPTEASHETAKYPASEGWYVSSGLAVKVAGVYFNEFTPELLVDGYINVVEDGVTISPADVITVHVYQDGYELDYVSGVDFSEPLTSESFMPLSEIYEIDSYSETLEVEIDFKNGDKYYWNYADMW